MPRQIQGSQTDFSYGEVDPDLKRNDAHPARKGGLRQMANARIHNSGSLANRSGRRALYAITNGMLRSDRFTISSGNIFDIQFGPGRIKIVNSAGVTVGNFTLQGNGAVLPWVSAADINNINFVVFGLAIYICFGHAMRPQVVRWDGVSTWSIADYSELLVGNQLRTPFYRLIDPSVGLSPSASTGNITLTATQPIFNSTWVGTRVRFVGRQILITGTGSGIAVLATVEESLPGSQNMNFSAAANTCFNLGDVVIGSVSGAKGVVVTVAGTGILVQLLTTATTSQTTATTTSAASPNALTKFLGGVLGTTSGAAAGANASTLTFAFTPNDTIVGPGGGLVPVSVSGVGGPSSCTVWDQQVISTQQGYPASVFTDQFRLGFCDFPNVPGAIAWSGINSPTDLAVGAQPADGMFEIAPTKVRVFYVVPGPEGSEFVFTDRGIFYIPISETDPLRPGSVAFKRLTGDGCAQVQPRIAQEAILYVNAGQNSMMAIIATGAYLRPFNTKSLSDFHAHLFTNIVAIATPSADGSFNERYAYVLNSNGAVVVGKYDAASLPGDKPVIGWGPWSGVGTVNWVAANGSDVVFTSSYFGNGVVEILDDAQYMDAALPVNNLPAPFVVGGKGPLWLIAAGQTVTLMDQVTRNMGIYQVDANGFITPQFNGGEDLTRASLVAGQSWSMTIEPFAPDAPSGSDMHQRMKMRQIAMMAVYFLQSSGFTLAMLFSGKQIANTTATTPALGTPMNQRRIPSHYDDEDATQPPILREWVETYNPTGSSYDPRAAVIKDTPGPLTICEIALEVSI